jgi:hypothetical protein
MPVIKSVSILSQFPGGSSLAIPALLSNLGCVEEHVALLVGQCAFALLFRWNDLLDSGVAAVFGVTNGEADLLAISFHAGQFTSARATTWLAERHFRPLFFIPSSSRLVHIHDKTAEMEARLVTHLQARMGSRIRYLRVVCRYDGVVLQGRACTYYAKQLAQHSVLEITNLPILANEIEVCLPGRKPDNGQDT